MLKRPILQYHGGKWKLAEWVISHLPQHRVYVEPFGGAASVLLKKPRSYSEVYNDMDGEIVNLFRVVRDHGDAFLRSLELTPFARDEFDTSFERSGEPVEQARRTVMRSFMGFGSSMNRMTSAGDMMRTGFRANCNRSGTTPAQQWRSYPDALPQLIERLRGVVVENRDACEVMLTHDAEEAVHYVDPPYVSTTRDGGADYRHEMDDAAHEKLAEVLHGLRGAVVLSGYSSPLYDKLYRDWRRVSRMALADRAMSRTEVLWLSPRCPAVGLFDGLAA